MPSDIVHTVRRKVNLEAFNPQPLLPFELRIEDFQVAMQDIYDFFYDVNVSMEKKGASAP